VLLNVPCTMTTAPTFENLYVSYTLKRQIMLAILPSHMEIEIFEVHAVDNFYCELRSELIFENFHFGEADCADIYIHI